MVANKLLTLSIAADERTASTDALIKALRHREYQLLLHGVFQAQEKADWAWAAESVAYDVACGRAQQGIVCCWTGTGVTIVANKVPGVRAALCGDAQTAAGARKWNDANVLALSLRTLTVPLLDEILTAWFETQASQNLCDQENIAHIQVIEQAVRSLSSEDASF